jgi:peroxiredoxin
MKMPFVRNIFFSFIFLYGVFFSLQSCSNSAKVQPGAITGQLKNAAGASVYLESVTDSGEVYLDSVKADAYGKFVLPNRATKLDYYMIRTDATNAIFLVLQGNEIVEITGNAKDLENSYTISGSKDSELIQQLKRFDKYLSDSLFYHFKQESDKNPIQRDSLIRVSQATYAKRMELYAQQFLDLYPSSIVSLSVTRYLDNSKPANMALVEKLNKTLMEKYPDNVYVQKFSAGMEELKALPAGSMAPEISLPDPSGKTVKLSSLRGKIVLVDFWASWCGPCRKENPNVVAMYARFHSKGFEIYGVSLDDNKEKWLEAVKTDHITWQQVSELKKWESGVVNDYHIGGIPFTVLIDRNGKIIAKGLRGSELEQKLNEVL